MGPRCNVAAPNRQHRPRSPSPHTPSPFKSLKAKRDVMGRLGRFPLLSADRPQQLFLKMFFLIGRSGRFAHIILFVALTRRRSPSSNVYLFGGRSGRLSVNDKAFKGDQVRAEGECVVRDKAFGFLRSEVIRRPLLLHISIWHETFVLPQGSLKKKTPRNSTGSLKNKNAKKFH